MDGFDDLLDSSRNVLGNPFEDPFAKRSSSPDPWSSYNQATASAFHDEEPNAFAADGSTTPTQESPKFETTSIQDQLHPVTDDPLDSAARTNDESEPETPASESLGPTSPLTPGFRESISASVVEESKEEATQLAQPSSLPLFPTSDTPVSPPPPVPDAPTAGHHSRSSTASLSSTLNTQQKQQRTFQTPLDQPTRSDSLERSIAALAIGGESIGGWQSSQNTFVGGDQYTGATQSRSDSDDDDDDDRPILQTATARASLGDRVSSLAVRIRLLLH